MGAIRLLIFVAALLQGCGQTGPLVYPDQEPPRPEDSGPAPTESSNR